MAKRLVTGLRAGCLVLALHPPTQCLEKWTVRSTCVIPDGVI